MNRPADDGSATAALFAAEAFEARALEASDIPALQRFFEDSPEYFLAVNGAPPSETEAREEFDGLPPAEMPFNERWLIGFYDDADRLAGFAGVLGDFLAPGVWHVGIFIVATALHGTGVAHSMYQGLERWMVSRTARWARLGVVEGNARAERFWFKVGYIEVRKRTGVAMGHRSNTVRVLVKPLADGTMNQYLALVARDNPEPLPHPSSIETDAITIRVLGADDAWVLDRVAPGVFDNPIDPRWTNEFVADARHHLVVALDEDEVVGMASAVHYVHPDKPPELWVNEVGVAPSHQNRGIGKRLLAALFAHGRALGCSAAWLGTEESNVAARRLYASSGGHAEPMIYFTFELR